MLSGDKWTTDLFFEFLRSQLLLLILRLFWGERPRAPYRGSLIVAGDSLAFPAQLAAVLGENEALILQKFHEWIEYNEWSQKRDHFIDGRWWTYNTYAEWQEKHFWWLSVSSVKRICVKLEKAGVLLSGRHAKSSTDQTKWYAIDYQKLSTIVSMGVSKRVPSADQKSPIGGSKESHDSNSKAANKSSNDKKSNINTKTARAKVVTASADGDDGLQFDSGEENLLGEKPTAPRFEATKHEADAPPVPSPSSAAPLPSHVLRLVQEKNLNPAVARRWVETVSAEECERAAEAALNSRRADEPAALWCSFMQKRDYQHMPTVQQAADDYSPNYSVVDDTPAVDEFETEIDPLPYIDPERVEQWRSAFAQLEIQLDKPSFETWLHDAGIIGFEAETQTFVIGVRNQYAQQYLSYRLNKKIDRVLGDVVGAPVTIRYEVYKPRQRHEDEEMPLNQLVQS